MSRGKVKGTLDAGSWNSWLLSFYVGERRYVEVSEPSQAARMMRTVITPKSRRPESMNGMEWVGRMYTAVGVGRLGDVRYLLCVERVE